MYRNLLSDKKSKSRFYERNASIKNNQVTFGSKLLYVFGSKALNILISYKVLWKFKITQRSYKKTGMKHFTHVCFVLNRQATPFPISYTRLFEI